MKKTFAALAAATIATMAMPALAQIKIGVVGPITGQYAAFGEQMVKGATMAVDEINAKGGIGGVPIELICYDTQTLEAEALKVVSRLVERDTRQQFLPMKIIRRSTVNQVLQQVTSPTTSTVSVRRITTKTPSMRCSQSCNTRRLIPLA